MAHPEGTKIQKDTVIRKERRIPVKGEVLVAVGDIVLPEATVAKGVVTNPEVHEMKVYADLGVDPEQAHRYMLKAEGDDVKRNEVIAIHRSFFGRSTKVCRSPIDGTIEVFSKTSGRALIRGRKIPVEVKAHVPGKVIEIIQYEGATIEAKGTLVQGVFGVGGEARGELVMAVGGPSEALSTEAITGDHEGKVLVGGSLVTIEALRKASRTRVAGIISGGVDQKDLADFIGHEIGIGVTGDEKIDTTLIITEGFGTHPMDSETFKLLKSHKGRQASLDGSTQIRSRMLRPEVIVPQ